jgi:hypothetical protein
MKRALLIPLIVLFMASMACSLVTGKRSTQPPVEPTEEVVAPQEATKPPAKPAAKPTKTEAAPTEEPAEDPTEEPAVGPTEEPSEAAPTDEPAPAEATEFEDSFEKDSKKWSDPVVVTSQAPGRAPIMKFAVGSGVLRWGIHDKETYAYKFFTDEIPGATVIDAAYTNKGAINTSIALVCNANADRTSWYEARILGTDNTYHFYEYSKARRTDEGKNPYIELSKGTMKYSVYAPMKPSRLVLTCTENELALNVNGGKLEVSYATDHALDGTGFGIGVLSAEVLPATVEFESVTIK